MAVHLGFMYEIVLEIWARENRKLWGNSRGANMFFSVTAFQEKLDDEVSLKSITNWWIKVHNRTHPDVRPIKLIK